MQTDRRILTASIAVTVALGGFASLQAPGLRAQGFEDPIPPEQQNVFKDLAWGDPTCPRWDNVCISFNVLREKGILQGRSDGTADPDGKLNRAEVAKYLGQAFFPGLEPASVPFPDVRRGEWYHVYVGRALAAGIIRGYDDGLFRPANLINRAEFAKMLVEAADVPHHLYHEYDDVDPEAYFAKYVGAFWEYELFENTRDGHEFRPGFLVTRAEAAVAVERMLRHTDGAFGDQMHAAAPAAPDPVEAPDADDDRDDGSDADADPPEAPRLANDADDLNDGQTPACSMVNNPKSFHTKSPNTEYLLVSQIYRDNSRRDFLTNLATGETQRIEGIVHKGPIKGGRRTDAVVRDNGDVIWLDSHEAAQPRFFIRHLDGTVDDFEVDPGPMVNAMLEWNIPLPPQSFEGLSDDGRFYKFTWIGPRYVSLVADLEDQTVTVDTGLTAGFSTNAAALPDTTTLEYGTCRTIQQAFPDAIVEAAPEMLADAQTQVLGRLADGSLLCWLEAPPPTVFPGRGAWREYSGGDYYVVKDATTWSRVDYRGDGLPTKCEDF